MSLRGDGGLIRDRRGSARMADNGGDPMESMGNLFDIGILIGLALLIFALSGMGLNEMLTSDELTVVKNPGTPQMEIITKSGGEIKTLKASEDSAEGTGTAVGTVYQLGDGQMIWVPGTETP